MAGWDEPTPSGDIPVSIRSSILALTALAVGTAALAPTGASAHLPMGVIIKPKPVLGVVIKPPIQGLVLPPHPIMGVPVNPHPILGVVIHNPDHDHDGDGPHFGWGHHYRSPVVIESDAPRVSSPVVTVPSTPAPCTCLTKSYLQDGSVLFRDVCTKEAAVATPDQLRAQMQ
jgi:hypothetical protein